MENNLDIQNISHLLPQRYPFLMIDRVIKIEPGKRLEAIKNVTINEHFFMGHFPGNPVMPGVLILEALAQAASILGFQSLGKNHLEGKEIFYLAGIDNARFKQIVRPGDQLILQIELNRHKGAYWRYKATALVEDKIACTAEIIGYFETNTLKKVALEENPS